MNINDITEKIIGAAIAVHRVLGPGLLESAYQSCFLIESIERGLNVESQVPLSIKYKSGLVHCAYRMDFVVEKQIVVELKSVDKLADIHIAQMLTYLKMSGFHIGLILNFNVEVMTQGIRRVVLSESQRPLRTLR